MDEKKSNELLAEVAIPLPFRKTFSYLIPDELKKDISIGKRVLVPFRTRKLTGYVIGFPEKAKVEKEKLKQIISVLDSEAIFDEEELELFKFSSRYYFAPIGEVIKTALPSGINITSKKIVRITGLGEEAIEYVRGRYRRVLELLFEFQELDFSELEEFLGEKIPQRIVKELEKKGYLEIEQILPSPKAKPRFEFRLKLTRKPSAEEKLKLEKRAPQQARLVEYLQKNPEVWLCELKEGFAMPLQLARALEKKGFLRIERTKRERKPFSLELLPSLLPEQLTPEQKLALAEIQKSITENQHKVFLLEGVTGSGKTEVYLQAMKIVLSRGKSAMLLVPEISLTPQLFHRVQSRFPEEEIATLHSGLSAGERFDQWWKIRRGNARVVLGARSAVFAPLKNLGLIVVDEEQESAYKQENGFFYNARDIAVYRGKAQGSVVILGSATPSLESAYNARYLKKYELLRLTKRVDSRQLPRVEVVDLKKSIPESPQEFHSFNYVDSDKKICGESLISEHLYEALKDTYQRGNQAIIFLNRRGYAPTLLCVDCGNRFLCPNCSVSLTWHRQKTEQKKDRFYEKIDPDSYLFCHYCGYQIRVPQICPKCLSTKIFDFGAGTERIEKRIKDLFPQARVARMDRDTMGTRKAYFEMIQKLELRKIDFLIGTQMVAKGHDLSGVTLVGVLIADQSLNIPDFRSTERTFQLITQVAGRAGRGDIPGRVIIQTFNPSHYAIHLSIAQDYHAFFEEEIKVREKFNYPPFSRLLNIKLSGIKLDRVRSEAFKVKKISSILKKRKMFQNIRVLGPAPAPLSRLRGRYRWQVLLFAPTHKLMDEFVEELIKKIEPTSAGVKLELDRDPVSLL